VKAPIRPHTSPDCHCEACQLFDTPVVTVRADFLDELPQTIATIEVLREPVGLPVRFACDHLFIFFDDIAKLDKTSLGGPCPQCKGEKPLELTSNLDPLGCIHIYEMG